MFNGFCRFDAVKSEGPNHYESHIYSDCNKHSETDSVIICVCVWWGLVGRGHVGGCVCVCMCVCVCVCVWGGGGGVEGGVISYHNLEVKPCLWLLFVYHAALEVVWWDLCIAELMCCLF